MIAVTAVLSAAGQEEVPFLEWLARLQTLRGELGSLRGDQPDALGRLRKEAAVLRNSISRWLLAHPHIPVSESETRPPECGDGLSLEAEIERLKGLVEELIRLNPAGPFRLGRVEVTVTAEAPQAPGAVVLDAMAVGRLAPARLTDVLNMAPGVVSSRIGSRGEGVANVRGFDMRQIPIYLDGIPTYAPYEGYADLDRFTVHEIAEVQIAKGFSSPLYGPNALGGAINLISRKPAARLHADLGAGYESGRAFRGFGSLGARLRKWYFQVGGAGLGRHHFPLSADFDTNQLQPTLERRNSDRRDTQGQFKAGFTPHDGHEYVVGYFRQSTRKGQAPYAGADPDVKVRYWRWPSLEKDMLYHIANRSLGQKGHLRLRAYYDWSGSRLESYDDASYSTMKSAGAFISMSNDRARGAVVELGMGPQGRPSLTAAFFFKDDAHQEHNVGEPVRKFHSQTLSLGLEHSISLGRSLRAAVGLSIDRLGVLRADDFRNSLVVPFPTSSLCALGPQAGITWAASDLDRLRFSIARKTRLPTMKDRYSYRMGRSIPNPGLAEERADTLEVAYSRSFASGTFVETAVFDSEISGLMQSHVLAPGLYQFRNLGRSRHSGAELCIRSSLASRLWIHANYTFLNRRNLSEPGVPLIQTPRHALFASASGRLPAGMLVTGEAHFASGRWDLSEAGRFVGLSGFTVLGGNASIPLGHKLELQAGVRNLADRNYFLDEGFPEEGRSYYLSLRYRF